MKTIVNTVAILLASSTPLAVATEDNGLSLEKCYPSVPDYTYQGKQYSFGRMKYNSVCVDSNSKQYQWGKIEGVWPPIDEPNSGCSKVCISGYGRGQARGCSSMKPDKLVGYNYNCDEAACYCLYEKGTWSGNSSPCFDSMDTSNQGHGVVSGTKANPGSTCYRVTDVEPAPTPAPQPRKKDICTGQKDYDCYKTGRPACCSSDEYECPDFMTMCDNHPERMSSPSYCVWSPDYKCYHMGWPSCCSAPGGDIMNCPRDEHPPCESNAATARGVAANDIVKFLRGN